MVHRIVGSLPSLARPSGAERSEVVAPRSAAHFSMRVNTAAWERRASFLTKVQDIATLVAQEALECCGIRERAAR